MRQGLAFLFFLFCHLAVQAQDRLYAGGSREPRLVKITHIAETDLYFRLPGDTANLEYVMALRRLDSVILANGDIWDFGHIFSFLG